MISLSNSPNYAVKLMIIMFIISTVIKIARKKKGKNEGNQEGKDNKTFIPAKETTIHRVPANPNIRRDTKPIFNDTLQLKRCSNCGGEIPLSMMKCSICGKNQPGTEAILWIVVILLVLFVVSLFARGHGVPVEQYFIRFIEIISSQ